MTCAVSYGLIEQRIDWSNLGTYSLDTQIHESPSS